MSEFKQVKYCGERYVASQDFFLFSSSNPFSFLFSHTALKFWWKGSREMNTKKKFPTESIHAIVLSFLREKKISTREDGLHRTSHLNIHSPLHQSYSSHFFFIRKSYVCF